MNFPSLVCVLNWTLVRDSRRSYAKRVYSENGNAENSRGKYNSKFHYIWWNATTRTIIIRHSSVWILEFSRLHREMFVMRNFTSIRKYLLEREMEWYFRFSRCCWTAFVVRESLFLCIIPGTIRGVYIDGEKRFHAQVVQ